MLKEIPLERSHATPPEIVLRIHEEGLKRAESISCFDFVPSDPVHLWQTLKPLSPGRFCEWGSGVGVGVAIATSLGWSATGIELNQELVAAARQLLADHRLDAEFREGSYLELDEVADCYFVYCWPGRMQEARSRFSQIAADGTRLLLCHGASDIRGYEQSLGASELES